MTATLRGIEQLNPIQPLAGRTFGRVGQILGRDIAREPVSLLKKLCVTRVTPRSMTARKVNRSELMRSVNSPSIFQPRQTTLEGALLGPQKQSRLTFRWLAPN
jgi:hypothetical protein